VDTGEVDTEVHIVRAIRHIGMDEAAHDPTMMKKKDAWHLCAITVECTRMMTSEQRGESPPPHAKSQQLCKPSTAQSEHAIKSSLRVSDGRDIAESIVSSKGCKRLRTAHMYESKTGAVFLNAVATRCEICERFTAEAAA
jgi:hypothetical protein